MLLDFKNFFNGVVDDEKNEESLAGHDKVIHSCHVTNKFQGTEVERWDAASSGWVFKKKSEDKLQKL